MLYSESEEWDDVEPIPFNDGGPHPLAAITYPDKYKDATAYLRAVMAKEEKSERVLRLTEDIIKMNPAHYTVWLYRASTLFAMQVDLRSELEWLNRVALQYLKNYQIWQHRQMVVDKLDSWEGEQEFLKQMFEKDAKNYHVWSYRQWLVRRFNLFDNKEEMHAVEELLKEDVRNNSAWNHRWCLVFGKEDTMEVPKATIEKEIEYSQAAIRLAPQNQSPWNYLKAVLRKSGASVSTLKDFTSEFASVKQPDSVRSSHALDLLAEILAEENAQEDASDALNLLAERYDPMRANYWAYRKSLLPQFGATVSS